jgi:glycine cleavage system H protein
MSYPENFRYTKEHEWVSVEGGIATIGITDHAQQELGDIVYVELPSEGKPLAKGDSFGSVESVKAVSDVYAPLSGTVTAANTALNDAPELLNQDPHGDAWLIKIELADAAEFENLLSAADYEAYVAAEH